MMVGEEGVRVSTGLGAATLPLPLFFVIFSFGGTSMPSAEVEASTGLGTEGEASGKGECMTRG